MLKRFYSFIDSILAPPGSPGNPEVLEPDAPVRVLRFPRFRLILILLTLILLITLPALLAASGAYWLMNIGIETGNILAWVVLFLFAPFVFLLGSFAVMADTALIAGIAALIKGKPVLQVRFARTTANSGHRYRDVQPIDVEKLNSPDFR